MTIGSDKSSGSNVSQATPPSPKQRPRQSAHDDWIYEAWPVAICGLLLLLGLILEFGFGYSDAPWTLGFWLFIGACLAGGVPTGWSTLRSLWKGRLDVDFLMLLGAVGAASIGHLDEAAGLLFLFALSETLQTFAMGRTRKALECLTALRPDQVTRLRGDRAERVALEAVQVGDHILVIPGDRVPLDGVVADGEADVDESTLTGEAVPRFKERGARVLAGSINISGKLVLAVSQTASNSTLSRIIELVEQARERRAPTQRILDQFAKFYIAFILLATVGTATIPVFFFGANASDMFYRAMMLMVVASPCALAISAPATILSAIATAARHGILFKGGAAVETLGQAEVIAFDKTGTLTDGVLTVQQVESLNGHSADVVLALAAAAESHSEHPLAKGIVFEARKRQLTIPPANNFHTTAGLGVTAQVEGHTIHVGSVRYLQSRGIAQGLPPDGDGGGKGVWVAQEEQTLGAVLMADRIRPESKQATAQLRHLGIEQIVMLTGDDPSIARPIGAAAGIDDVRASLLPEQKVEAVRELASHGRTTVMVGDGVNDAPAMAAAHIGVAMGAAGTDVALEAADVVLMASNLNRLADAVQLARRARTILYQNLGFAIAVIVILVTLALSGVLLLPVGVIGHEGSTLIVVLNGLRLLAWKPQPLPVS